jgi:hypothetical protein
MTFYGLLPHDFGNPGDRTIFTTDRARIPMESRRTVSGMWHVLAGMSRVLSGMSHATCHLKPVYKKDLLPATI